MIKTCPPILKSTVSIFLGLVVLLAVNACGSNVGMWQDVDSDFRPRKLLIVSFRNVSDLYGQNVGARSPISGKVFVTGEVGEGAEELLTGYLIAALEAHKEYTLISPGRAQGAQERLMSKDLKLTSERELAVATGKALEADAVLMGHLYRFQDRMGSRYAIESPASVAFDLYMIRVSSGQTLWSGYFDETQRALSEDLFRMNDFFRRGGAWITAQEMALTGLKDVLKTFPAP